MGKDATVVYKPRSGGINKNLSNYKPEQLEYTKNYNEDMIHFFGYAEDGKEENRTPFFDYQGKAKPENVAMMNQFKEMNKQSIKNRFDQLKNSLNSPSRNIRINNSKDKNESFHKVTELEIMKRMDIQMQVNFD